jgi:dethiobiotin synthetase
MTPRGVFVTGTDTGVGKTVVSAALLIRYLSSGVRYWKPIQTGIEQDDDTAEVLRLSAGSADRVLDDGVRLPRPVSPHLAARLSGVTIDGAPLIERLLAAGDRTAWVVEGAGGVLVPINDRETMADLMAALGLPVVVAARSSLGTINHTLLTLEALARRSIAVAGIVMVGAPDEENRAAIERYGRATILGEMPAFSPLTPGRLATWAGSELDRDGRLARLFEPQGPDARSLDEGWP